MAEFFTGVILSLFVGMFLIVGVLDKHKKEAFDRGFMVQCVGKTGYYWECDNE